MRLQTPTVQIGKVKMGSQHHIVIQSMTNTDTADASATAAQIIQLADAGSDVVRITVNNEQAAKAVPKIREILNSQGYQDLPLVGDFHFNGEKLLTQFPKCAQALDKYRINPGNVSYGRKDDENFRQMIEIAIQNNKPVRIGVNWGSLDQKLLTRLMNKNAKSKSPKTSKEIIIQAMVESAISSAKFAESLGLNSNKIVLSVKMSDVQDTVAAYQKLAQRMKRSKKFYALHLGLTEAGSGMQGLIASTSALSILLQQGLGDTIRISLTPEPGQARTDEVKACKHLLQALGLRHFQPKVTSCPGCGRTDSDYFQKLAAEVNSHIQESLQKWQKTHPQVATLKVAVMGCVVNGPGESRYADIAISLPGTGEQKMAPVFLDGKFHKTLVGDKLSQEFIQILDKYIEQKYL